MSKSNYRTPLGEIDLNAEIPPSTHIEHEDDENNFEEYYTSNLPDLNLNPNPVLSNQLLFDLNCDPLSNSDLHQFSTISDEIVDEDNVILNSLPTHDSQGHLLLSNEKRQAIFIMLQQKSVNGKLRKGTTTEVASSFSVPIRTIQRIWKQGKGSENNDVSNRWVKNCGRKRIAVDLEKIQEVPLQKRTTLESLSYATKISKTTLFRHLQKGDIRRHSNAIKPFLKEENKRMRLKYCLSMVDSQSIPHDPTFRGMYNMVHIDEKWFYMTRKSEKYYLLPNEEEPLRTCKSKNFIAKVMFLVALARPRFDVDRNEIFSGKIGVFPFITQEPAKRNSVNRVAGTMETKPITSITRDVMKAYLIEKVVPAIKEKWPREEAHLPIFIQQDNAKTHISLNDEDFHQAASKDGFDIRLMCQPANSPDLNVLDLGFFAAIQSLQYREAPKNVDELIDAVVKAFDVFSTVKSDHIFLTLQLCMLEIMKAKGSQQYKIPHMRKLALERTGELPAQIKCDTELIQEVAEYLNLVE